MTVIPVTQVDVANKFFPGVHRDCQPESCWPHRSRWAPERPVACFHPPYSLGAAWDVALNHFFPGLNVSPAAFAVAGMGGVVGGPTGAAMAAIMMIFEMTLDYQLHMSAIIATESAGPMVGKLDAKRSMSPQT